MTPLAGRLAKQLASRVTDRDWFWRNNGDRLRHAIEGTHFFEVTAAWPLVIETSHSVGKLTEDDAEDVIARYAFLPAPKTWIEWRHPPFGGRRIALHLEEAGDWAWVYYIFAECAGLLGRISLISNDWEVTGERGVVPEELTSLGQKFFTELLSASHFWLLLINSPRVIGRRNHMPHKGIEKRLVRTLGVGMFPLHGWTEIKLEVAKPPEIDDGEPHEAHLTGRRALHFCRKHIRIRNGRLEYVSAHWRGDPALGIKRSRYTLEV